MCLILCHIPDNPISELEGDGYVKNKRLLEINPKGLVPTLEVMTKPSGELEVIKMWNDSGHT